MSQILPSALVPYNPIVALVQQPSPRRQQAAAKLASASTPIAVPGVTLLPEHINPPARVIEYAYKGLSDLSFMTFDRLSAAVCRIADQMVRYAKGEINQSSWERAVTELMREGKRINKGNLKDPQPDLMDTQIENVPRWMSAELRRPGDREAAQRLHDLLFAFFNLDLKTTCGNIVDGEYRYTLNTLRPYDRLLIERLDPGGKEYFHINERAHDPESAKAILGDLEIEWQRRKALLDRRVEVRGPEEIDAAIEQNVAERMAAYQTRAAQRASARTQQSLFGTQNPFTPPMQSLAAGS